MTLLGALASNAAIAASDLADFDEAVDDRLNSVLVAGSNVTLTYNDVANTLTIDSTGGGGGGGFIDTVADTGHPGTGTDIDLNVTGTTLTAKLLSTATPQLERVGLGVAAGATARITLPATASLAGGIDFGGTASLQYVSAGKVKFERPSGGLSHFEINAASGQDALLGFSEAGTSQWRLRHTASNGVFTIRDEPGTRDVVTFNPDGTTLFNVANTGAVNSAHRAYQFQQSAAWDGGSTDGGGSTDNRSRVRISISHIAGFTNSTNGTRGDVTTSSGALSGGHTGWDPYFAATDNFNAKGGWTGFQNTVQLMSKPTGTNPAASHDNYAEVVGFVSRIEDVRSMGTYAGCFESLLKISNVSDNADAGPIRGFGALFQVQERNAYSTYNNSAIFDTTTGWTASGGRGLWIHSSGSAVLGTGIHMRGSAGYKRFITGCDAAGVEQFCVDGQGNIGVRRVTDQSTTLVYALTIGYTSAGVASTVEGDGIGMGGDVELFRSAANTLRTPDALSLGSFISQNSTTSAFLQQTSLTSAPGTGGASTVRLYVRNGKVVFAYNDAGTNRYLTCDVTSTGTGAWAFSTTAP